MSLRTRLAALVALIVLTASTVGGIGIALSSLSIGRNQVDNELHADMDRLDPTSPRLATQLQFMLELRRTTCTEDAEGLVDLPVRDAPGRRNGLERIRPFLDDFASSMQVVRDNDVIVSGCRTLPVDDAEQAIAINESGTSIRTVGIDGTRYRVLTEGFPGVGAVQIARDLDLTESTLRGLFVRVISFGAIGAIVAGLIGWFLARRATEPIEQLNEAATRIAATRDLGERIHVDGSDEVGALAGSFNSMLESLDTSREQQRRLVQDASHELRTPLTSMRTNVELLQRHPNVDPEIRAQVLDDIAAELGELTELTTELVDSATEMTVEIDRAVNFDLGDVVEDCVERARRRFRRDIALTMAPDTGLVSGDPALLARAVTNLVNNAAKFCEAPGVIAVSTAAGRVVVTDEGPGIPDADLGHVFERFYRSTTARSAPGSGLGLAIVRQIVDAHGGEIQIQNRSSGGLEVGFSLPPSDAGAAPTVGA